jgi:predicted regulator of Ras-like GTPase activity (Roadblock/LC7/MglB family)
LQEKPGSHCHVEGILVWFWGKGFDLKWTRKCFILHADQRLVVHQTDLIIYPEEFAEIRNILAQLAIEVRAKLVFLVDRNGQPIASHGESEAIDTMSLSSLAAGNVAATEGLAKLLGEREFSVLFHEGERDNIHFSIVAHRAILVVIFDHRTPVGLVRLRVRKSSAQFEGVFERIMAKLERDKPISGTTEGLLFPEITDEDIDRLFSE